MIQLSARYVVPVDGPVLEPGRVRVAQGRIVAVEGCAGCGTLDFGASVILPGLVNAHTHLEFSELAEPLGEPDTSFADWVRRVIEWRRQLSDGEESLVGAVRTGMLESLAGGATAVGEICSSDGWRSAYHAADGGGVVFRELLGLARRHIDPLLNRAEAFLGEFAAGNWRVGLSPHAPYTIGPRCLERILELAAAHGAPVAMHLAETMDELELLAAHSGPLFELLEDLDAWDPTALPRGLRPGDFLRLLARAPRSLVIHGNYLDDEDLELIAQHRERMSVVYCPRTHAWFNQGLYPLRRLLEAGINVAVATDSRASNPDLSLLAELQFAARRHTDLPAADLLRLGTWNAARALGLDDSCGSLRPGKRADLTIVDLAPDGGSAEPLEQLLRGAVRVRCVLAAGRLVYSADGERTS
jgi:cytosine/adenosine deaminase-related metal-dependent hydrolase